MAYDPATGYRVELPDEGDLIRDEVRHVVHLPASERVKMLAAACATGVQLMQIKSATERQRILDYRAPLPADAEATWARLRAEHRAKR